MSTVALRWVPRSWHTRDTSDTVRRVIAVSQSVREEAIKTTAATYRLQEAASEFVRQEDRALRAVARYHGGH